MKTLIRGKSIGCSDPEDLAILKYANIKIADVNTEKNRLIDEDDKFSLISSISEVMIDMNGKIRWHENKIGNEIEMTSTIEIGPDLYIGKSTTEGLSKAKEGIEQRRTLQRAKWKARNEAERKLFNNFFGVDGIKEFTIDEMGRPVETN